MISVEFPQRAAFEMLPGATKQKVDRWMDEREDEQYQSSLLARRSPFRDTTTIHRPRRTAPSSRLRIR